VIGEHIDKADNATILKFQSPKPCLQIPLYRSYTQAWNEHCSTIGHWNIGNNNNVPNTL